MMSLPKLYIYGSENRAFKSLMHIADDSGKPLCKTPIRWGEVTAEITLIENGRIFATSFGGGCGNKNASEIYAWSTCKCKKCDKLLVKAVTDSKKQLEKLRR